MGTHGLLPALFLATAAGFLATLALTGVLPLPPEWGASSTQARTIALEGGAFGHVAEPPAIPAPGGGSPLVGFQGRLTNPGTGLPVPNASYSITFRIFDAPAGGNQVWIETQSVAVSGGLFNVLLGSVTPLDAGVFSNTKRYLEVKVSPDPAMTPRLQFGYAPYAFQAEQAGALSRLGFSLTTVDSAGNVGTSSSLTIGSDGLPVVSHFDTTNGDLKVAHCGNAGCSGGNSVTTVDSAGQVGIYTSITIGADGLPLISYLDNTTGDLKVAHCGDAACSTACGVGGTTCTTVDSAGNTGHYTSITIGADGLPVISYQNLTDADLKVAHCGDAACSTVCGVGGTTCTPVDSSGGDVGAWTSITIGADGLPVVSYFDATNGDLKAAHCGNADCSAGNAITTVDSAGVVGDYTSIIIGVDALPVISYRDETNQDLEVVHCGNAACSAGNTLTTVDIAGDFGASTSITIGADGLPVISHRDGTNGDLKVARCGNVGCSTGCGLGGTTCTTVDSAGDVGIWTAITIGSDGLPVISYGDNTNLDLKVAHCSNRFCTPFHRPR